MGLNFPNNPVNGQVYSPYADGPVYVWDDGDDVWRFSPKAPPANVPDAPSDNKVYARENATWIPIPKITVATSQPLSPDPGDVWVDSSSLALVAASAAPPAPSLTISYVTDAPSDNVVYARENTAWVTMPKITAATTAPSSPDTNDLWVDMN